MEAMNLTNTIMDSGAVLANSGNALEMWKGPSNDGSATEFSLRKVAKIESSTITANSAMDSNTHEKRSVISFLPETEPREEPNYIGRKINKLEKNKRLFSAKIVGTARTTPNILTYMSKGECVNYNCKYTRNVSSTSELITCRHLAYSYAMKYIGGKKFDKISSKEKIEQSPITVIPHDNLLEDRFFSKYASDAIYFNTSTLGNALYDEIASDIKGEKSYILSTTDHFMALRIQKKINGEVIIYFYDPNDTLRQRKTVVEVQDYLKMLSIHDFLGNGKIKSYFANHMSACCLLSPFTHSKRDTCRVRYLSNPSEDALHLLLLYGHYGHSQVSIDFSKIAEEHLAGRNLFGCSGLFSAAKSGHMEAINSYLKDICSSQLCKTKKIDLILGKDDEGIPTLHFAALNGDVDLFSCFINTLADASDLTSCEIRDLITVSHRGESCWEKAKYYYDNDLFPDIKEIIIKSKLSHSLKQQLISDIDGVK